jgi:glycosyltransferase involved in cell wall biosynthesis
MRVLVLNWLDRENPRAGGAEVHLHETFGRLAGRAGWEVTLVSSGWKGAARSTGLDGIEVHRVGRRNTYPLHVAGFVRRGLAGRSFDIVVEDLNKVALFTPTWCGRPVLLLVHHLFGRTVFEEAGLHLALPTWVLEKPVPWIYRDVPTVAVSESTRQDLVDRGMRAERIEVIPNGITLGDFTAASPDDRFPEPTVLYLGRLKRYKRVDLLIRAVARLRDEGEAVRLLIAGKGDHRPELESEARRLGLGDDGVTFLGFVSEDEKRALLRRAWVHGFTSPKEGWGIANLEAAASGTATVASDAPGLRDSVVHGETGFLIPHGDVRALADAIRRITRDPGLREGLGRGGRRFAEGFSWDRTSAAMAAAMERVVAGIPSAR